MPKHPVDFPNEILRLIFHYVYFLAYDENDDAPEDVRDLSWSPYFIFVVCKRWRDVAATLPLYATRVMIYVDEPLSFTDLEKQIALSKPMRLKVFVVRKRYSPKESSPLLIFDDLQDEEQQLKELELQRKAAESQPPTDPLEKSCVVELMQVLVKHVQRFQVLVFDVLQRSSLPCLSHFRGHASKLRTLRFKSHFVDSMNHDPELISSNLNSFISPNLRYLDLDGAIFARAAQIPDWLKNLKSLPRKELSITNLFAGDYGAFDFYDLLSALSSAQIGHLTSLKLCNIHLNTVRCQHLPSVPLFVQNLEFVALPGEALVGFFAAHTNLIEVSYIKIRDCDLSSTAPFTSWGLSLYDIDAGDDIANFVRNWDGFSLHVENCPSVDDSLLKMMIEYETDNGFYVRSCRQLFISPFYLISAQALKDLITAREEIAERLKPLTPDMYPDLYPMHAVWLTGAGPPLSNDDRSWFTAKLDKFVWYTTCQGFESPKLDEDFAEWKDFPDVCTFFFVIHIPFLYLEPRFLPLRSPYRTTNVQKTTTQRA